VPNFERSTLHQPLPSAPFEQLVTLLLEEATAQGQAMVLTEVQIPRSSQERFVTVLSQPFCALLVGTPVEITPASARLYQVQLTFEREAIADFLKQLQTQPGNSIVADHLITQALAQHSLQPNEPQQQTVFTLKLIDCLRRTETPSATLDPQASVCQPVETALHQQIEQERLLNQVVAQIRQSLELPVILKTAVAQVRQFLQVDRLVIYQFQASDLELQTQPLEPAVSNGHVIYEALASDTIPSVLSFGDGYCFNQVSYSRDKYRQGKALAIADVNIAYPANSCLLERLQAAQVQATLIAPIITQQDLWGLLIAHQCSGPRQWQENERVFLQHIAEHLAVAICQAQLYAQLQQQKQSLEGRVVERTQDLHDALIAAQSANRAKSDFLATMSHELRTPLTCVIGMSATLLRWSFGPLTDKQRSYLKTIHDSGEHLLELINDILDLSKVEAGKAVLHISEFSLSQVARQSLKLLKEKARTGAVELKLDLEVAAEHEYFAADLRRIKQILYNLLANAVKFTPPGGQVTLRVEAEENAAIFQIQDTGIGIPESQLSLLFQKFQQLDSSYQRRYEGSGLGLALTKQLVELHGGWIEVDSREGQGSLFTVQIPTQPLPSQHPDASNRREDSEFTTPTGRIVLIEDHEETATLMCDILTTAGYQVVWMMETAVAVEQIQLLQPIALITDIQLPGMDGYELIRSLRQHTSTQALKILVLTAKAMPEDRRHCLTAGADDYLAKPIQPEQLLNKLAALLDISAEAAVP
jgi:two-component system, sensor histidine kinase and response regulator